MTRWCSSCEVGAETEPDCWSCGRRYDTDAEPAVTLRAPATARPRPSNTPTRPWWRRRVV